MKKAHQKAVNKAIKNTRKAIDKVWVKLFDSETELAKIEEFINILELEISEDDNEGERK